MDALLPIFFGLLVGISLGLTGGGGSILAVPLLVYGLGMELRSAVAVSLAVVGCVALSGAIVQARSGLVLWRPGAILGLGGIVSAPAGALLGQVVPERLALVLFAFLMLFVASRMWRGSGATEVPLTPFTCARDAEGQLHFSWRCAAKLLAGGGVTGLLSGFFGVGGGFLIAPVLLLVLAVPIEQVMATSLAAIALVSASGLVANLGAVDAFPWQTATWFLLGGLAGVVLGSFWKSRLSRQMLARGFAGMAVAVATYILIRVAAA